MNYKKEKSFETRKTEAEKIRSKYPDRIPIIVEMQGGSKNVPDIDKKKFLVPSDLTMGQFQYVVRKRIKVEPTVSIFMFVNGKIMAGHSVLSQVYEENADEDKFLYVHYTGENTFG